MVFWLAVLAYLATINIVSVLAFFWDKRMAEDMISASWQSPDPKPERTMPNRFGPGS